MKRRTSTKGFLNFWRARSAELHERGLSRNQASWVDILCRANLPASWEEDDDWSNCAQTLGRDTFRASYVEWMKNRRFDGDIVEERHFGRRLRDMLPTLGDKRAGGGQRVWQYILPPLSECREAFQRWLGSSVDWTY